MEQRARAETFAKLHRDGILVLPNAWDAASAALMADAGAKAVATSSAAVAWAHGYPDGDALPMEKVIATVAGIVRSVDLPVTCDFEGGYTDDPAELAANIARVLDAGAVGINFEDGGRDPDLHARKVAAARAAADRAGVPLFINARTDVYLRGLAEGEAAFDETVRRAKLYAEAGASGIFTPGAKDEALIGRLAAAIPLPLNIMLLPGLAPAPRLAELGVRRLSSATAPFRLAYASLAKGIAAYLATGEAAAFAADPLPNLNARFSR
ncbi:isocitrate lyase/phosphoenolpyruvate mutase family protein [Phenylobacterium sp. J367]|uniref:isocitrate lyase/PEP mutase family protein n=1 Tax=Phenylobacterium sp. J367 TaxID=2898435 RepID=UPI0021510C47|nr:isocitrate lyase/phosphoenolpyruvate mutase family protein [Phenylobacterium sp. J367]MCR5878289.1 isocitrate lyase/phosphoenolpyruvate mutase family protein [Phenylobacterium sp. J367]